MLLHWPLVNQRFTASAYYNISGFLDDIASSLGTADIHYGLKLCPLNREQFLRMLLLFNYMKMYVSVGKHNHLLQKKTAINKDHYSSFIIYYLNVSILLQGRLINFPQVEAQDFDDPNVTWIFAVCKS